MIVLVITIVAVGILLWAVNEYVPMDGKIKKILNVVVVLCLLAWICSQCGIMGYLDRPVPQIR